MADLTSAQCPPGAYCSKAGPTRVGGRYTVDGRGQRKLDPTSPGTQIYHRTVSTPIGDPKNPTGFKTQTFIEKNGQYVLAATTTDGGKTQTFTSDAGTDLRKAFQPGGAMAKATQDSAIAQLKAGGNTGNGSTAAAPYTDKQLQQAGLKPNVAPGGANPTGQSGDQNGSSPTPDPTQYDKDIEKELTTVKERKQYGNLQYPVNLNTDHQDFMKFTMLEYKPRGLGNETTGVIDSSERTKDRNSRGTVILPIPGGINDSNSANWKDDSLDFITAFLGDVAGETIERGTEGLKDSADKAASAVTNNTSEVQAFAGNRFVQAASGMNRLTRKFGLVENNNLELLFEGPGLRSFTFTFKMSARSRGETEQIKRIIRFFKQGMSAKKTPGGMFIKSPNTFQIEYYRGFDKEKLHPYLNKIKECALTNCSINYTPDGNYATFYDGAMTSYDMTLQFTELEPLFESDYGDDYDSIGY